MPRERSTWNVNAIAKRAGMKVADPYLMNQDHVNQQPSADEYVIGGPSEFAEDIHPAAGTWEAEYANGQVKRNEIGMPDMRGDTFNHPEKTASEEVITKKAALCVAIARKMLPKTASPVEIEDQGFSLMYLPDAEVMATYTRLAAQDQDQQDQQQQQQVQAAQQQDQQQQQQVQAAQQQDQQDQQQQQQQVQAAQQQDQQQQGQQVQAGQIPPQFLENVKKKKEEAEGKKDDDKGQQKSAQQDQGQQDHGQQQQKQAQQDQQQGQQDQGQQKQAEMQQQGMQQQLAALIQQAQQIQQQLAQSQQQQAQTQQQQQAGQQQQQAQTQQQQAQTQQQQAGQQQQQAQMQQQSQAQQVAQAVQQAIQNGQDPVAAAQQCMAQYQQQAQTQQQGNNEIDQMLAEQGQIEPVADMDIQLDTPNMDVGEIQLSPEEDDTLRQLFSNNQEYKNAQEAAGQQDQDQGQQQQKQAHVTRTASMRTVGTRPTGGVSQIGGSNRTASSAQGTDLSTLWNSAPDVREAFGMRTDQ
jgi:hypothetical protein